MADWKKIHRDTEGSIIFNKIQGEIRKGALSLDQEVWGKYLGLMPIWWTYDITENKD
jgi:hypothetical protein